MWPPVHARVALRMSVDGVGGPAKWVFGHWFRIEVVWRTIILSNSSTADQSDSDTLAPKLDKLRDSL